MYGLFGYAVFAGIEKFDIFSLYIEAINGYLGLSIQKIRNRDNYNNPLIADLSGDPLDLFLYLNRFQKRHIHFDSKSFRYRTDFDNNFGLDIFRVTNPGYLSNVFADITHTDAWQNSILNIIPYDNAVKIYGNNWLPPEGKNGTEMFRWLSYSGNFRLYIMDIQKSKIFKVKLVSGPDILPIHRIQLILSGKILSEISSAQLPVVFSVPLKNLKIGCNEGIIKIVGNNSGIRQLSVSHIGVYNSKN